MQKSLIQLTLAAILCAACASTQGPGSILPEPQTQSQTPSNSISKSSIHSWQFKFVDEVHSYTSVTQTTIEALSTPASSVDTLTTRSHFSIAIDQRQVPAAISGDFNQIEITISRQSHNQPPVASPFAFAGSISSGQVLLHLIPISTDSEFCSNPTASYLSELHAGVLTLPAHVQTGSTWTDTLSAITCSSNHLPLTIQIIRFYQVQNMIQEGNLELLLVKRTEQVQLSGSGSQDQHQMQIRGQGTGSADLLLDPKTGTLQTAQTNLRLDLTLLTSGKSYQFRQQSIQRLDLIR